MKSAENKAESVREVFTTGYVVLKYFKKIQQCLRFETRTHTHTQSHTHNPIAIAMAMEL